MKTMITSYWKNYFVIKDKIVIFQFRFKNETKSA